MVRRVDDKVRIYSRRGSDFTPRFPRIEAALEDQIRFASTNGHRHAVT
jgi:ATP-dependent DNA ligase